MRTQSSITRPPARRFTKQKSATIRMLLDARPWGNTTFSTACNLIPVFHDPVGRWPGSTGFWIRKRRRSGRGTGSASCSAWTTWKIPWPALARRKAKPQKTRRQPRRPRRRWGQGIIINNTSLTELRTPGRSLEDCRRQHRQPQRGRQQQDQGRAEGSLGFFLQRCVRLCGLRLLFSQVLGQASKRIQDMSLLKPDSPSLAHMLGSQLAFPHMSVFLRFWI